MPKDGPREKLSPNPKTNPNRGTIFFGSNCLVETQPKTNPNLEPNPNPNRGTTFLGGQLSGYQKK